MGAVNNLEGDIVKYGKLVYSEKLSNGLYFMVVLMYKPHYEGKNHWRCDSSEIKIECSITTGEKETWSNGVISYCDAFKIELINHDEKFKDVESPVLTKDGFVVKQVIFNEEYIGNNFKKSRHLKYFVHVPLKNLMEIVNKSNL